MKFFMLIYILQLKCDATKLNKVLTLTNKKTLGGYKN